jgi:hypothetical protein
MDTVYINELDNVITTPPTSATCFGDAPQSFGGSPPNDSIVAAIPDFDPGLWVQFANLGAVRLKLGEMKAGASSPALGSICHIPTYGTSVTVGGFPHLQILRGGLQVTVCQNPNVNAANPVPQSQTLYLVPGRAAEVLTPFAILTSSPFIGPGTLTAELIFDTLEVSGGVGDPWAVALNFKQNGQNDGGLADAAFGPTCQFSGTGTVKLNKVAVPVEQAGNYGDYKNTTFTLTTSLSVDQGNVSGVASLSFGQTVFSSAVNIPAGFDLDKISAVGIAVVSSKNTYTWVRAILRKFTLYATQPPFLGPVYPLPVHPPKGPPPRA